MKFLIVGALLLTTTHALPANSSTGISAASSSSAPSAIPTAVLEELLGILAADDATDGIDPSANTSTTHYHGPYKNTTSYHNNNNNNTGLDSSPSTSDTMNGEDDVSTLPSDSPEKVDDGNDDVSNVDLSPLIVPSLNGSNATTNDTSGFLIIEADNDKDPSGEDQSLNQTATTQGNNLTLQRRTTESLRSLRANLSV